MAMTTRTVTLPTDDWTLITSKIALLQFNDEMDMVVTDGTAPSESVGFTMIRNEKYVNSTDGIAVWAKRRAGGSNKESVRVAEDVV
jgi:hypothetical protein